MKRRIFALGLLLLMVATVSYAADRSLLLDFNFLGADYSTDSDDNTLEENSITTIDFSNEYQRAYSPEELAQMKTSLALRNWEVSLCSSSRTTDNQRLTMAVDVPVQASGSSDIGHYLGVRIHFPTDPFNSWAQIRPPFVIPAYQQLPPTEGSADDLLARYNPGIRDNTFMQVSASTINIGGAEQQTLRSFIENNASDASFQRAFGNNINQFDDGYGVLLNVGVLQRVEMDVFGLNFPHGLTLVLRDQNNQRIELFMGYLNFEGWRTLQWDNPNYVSDVRNRELRRYPLYPRSYPNITFDSLIIYRDAASEGGNFVSYFKDIWVTYDRAIIDATRDINDEEIWNILTDRERSRRDAEMRRLGETQVLRYLERRRMSTNTTTP